MEAVRDVKAHAGTIKVVAIGAAAGVAAFVLAWLTARVVRALR